MTIKIGELISQIRNQSKSVNQDNIYISDRLIYSLAKKHLALFIYREDANMKASKIRFIYTNIPYLELVEVDLVEAECAGISSDCTIRRTKEKLPSIMKGYNMPLISNVSSLDGKEKFTLTTPEQYIRKTGLSDYKYNKTKYYWYLNDYLYFPNVLWDAIKLEAVLDGEALTDCGEIDPCVKAQDIEFSAPDYLLSTVQSEVLKDIAFLLQVPKDPIVDKQTPNYE